MMKINYDVVVCMWQCTTPWGGCMGAQKRAVCFMGRLIISARSDNAKSGDLSGSETWIIESS